MTCPMPQTMAAQKAPSQSKAKKVPKKVKEKMQLAHQIMEVSSPVQQMEGNADPQQTQPGLLMKETQ